MGLGTLGVAPRTQGDFGCGVHEALGFGACAPRSAVWGA